MLFVLLTTYLGVWACAHAAARSRPGWMGFWLFYGLGALAVPVVSAQALGALFRLGSPAYADTITPLTIKLGILLALVAYPIKYLRSKHED